MSDYIIKTNQLTRAFGDCLALNNVDLQIENGRLVALLGPNGAGKTTLIQLLLGLLEPSEGNAIICDRESRELPHDVFSRIGYMGDNDNPPRWATANKLMKLQAEVCQRFDRGLAENLFQRHNILLDKPFGVMSKGQKKWLRAVLVLASKPDLLILDEPADGLDPAIRDDLFNLIREQINDTQATALVATHIISDIERVADELAIITEGQLLAFANLEDLREEVYEIYLSQRCQVDQLDNSFEPFAQQFEDQGLLVWGRCKEKSRMEIEKTLPAHATVRHVDLKTFYLAVTKNQIENKVEAVI